MHEICNFSAPDFVLAGKTMTFGQEPPIHRRSTTTVCCPDCADPEKEQRLSMTLRVAVFRF
jgi:hypothetical protein